MAWIVRQAAAALAVSPYRVRLAFTDLGLPEGLLNQSPWFLGLCIPSSAPGKFLISSLAVEGENVKTGAAKDQVASQVFLLSSGEDCAMNLLLGSASVCDWDATSPRKEKPPDQEALPTPGQVD